MCNSRFARNARTCKKLDYGIEFINYFNAGVMFINTSEWKKNNITQKALEMINSGKVYRYADQMCSIFYLMDECITLIRSTIIRQHCQYDVMKNKKLAQHNYNALCYPE